MNKLIRTILIVCFAGVACLGERLPVRIFTTADGLGSSFVDNVFRDSRGFLWFSTRDGLSRFDGSRFITYQVSAQNSPPGIEGVFESSKGEYWITTVAGIYRYKPNEVLPGAQLENKSDGRPNLNAEFISKRRGGFYEDAEKRLWFFSDKIFLVNENGAAVEFNEIDFNLPEKYANQNILDVKRLSDGSFWVLTMLGLFRRLPDNRIIYYDAQIPLVESSISFLEDKDGNVWLTRPNGLFIIKPETIDTLGSIPSFTVHNLPGEATFKGTVEGDIHLPEKSGEIINYKNFDQTTAALPKFLYKTSDEHIWITTTQNLIEFDGKKFNAHSTTQGFTHEPGRMTEDLNGNLWIGGQSGVVRLDRHGLTTYDIADAPGQGRVRSIYQSERGDIFAFIGQGFVSQFDGKDFRSARLQIPQGNQFLWTSPGGFLDSSGGWWILINPKLYRFAVAPDLNSLAQQKPAAVYDHNDGLPSDRMYCMFEDTKKNLYVSTRVDSDTSGNGLSVWMPEKNKFRRFTEAEGFPANKSPSSFATDAAGNLWFGFYEGGVVRYDGEHFTDFSQELNFGDHVVTKIFADRAGRLWLSSSAGGLVWTPDPGASIPRFNRLTAEDKLASNNIRSITEDNFGRIYIGSVRGIDRFTPETGIVKHYSTNDGLATDFVDTAFRDRDGVLWFGTPSGVSRLVPEDEKSGSEPPVLLGGLRVAGVEKKLSELGERIISSLELAPNENNLQIDFFGLNFKPSENLRYQYKLEGADKDWSVPTEQRTVNYANLSAGDYHFLVRAINADGILTAQPAEISFKILPPVWRRWWFLVLCSLFAIGIVIAVERYRAARLREVQAAYNSLSISENRFRKLVEQSPFGIMIFGPDGSVRSINETYLRLWGDKVTTEDIQKWDFFNDAQIIEGGVPEEFARVFEGEAVKFPPMIYDLQKSPLREAISEDAGLLWIQATAYPVKDFSGELLEVICFLENITTQKITEEKLARARLERLIELERVRSRIATDLHDDIGASLTQIAVLSEVAQQTSGGAAIAEPLTKISSVSNELVEAMSDIVWSINPAKDHLHDLTQRMRRFASDILSACGISFQFIAPAFDDDIVIGTNLRREVFLIFKESVNNIVKHSGARNVEIRLAISGENIKLEISDNGDGFDAGRWETNGQLTPDETKGGNGILSMRRRAREMNGELEIVSNKGQGTRLVLLLPLDQAVQTGGERAPGIR